MRKSKHRRMGLNFILCVSRWSWAQNTSCLILEKIICIFMVCLYTFRRGNDIIFYYTKVLKCSVNVNYADKFAMITVLSSSGRLTGDCLSTSLGLI